MESIDKWLKSLRLHKYSHLFNDLTYEQLLNIDENYLLDKNITKGARNKLLLSIKKLNSREEKLVSLIEDLDHGIVTLKEALVLLKDMLITPIPNGDSNELNCLYVDKLEQVAQRSCDNACHALVNTIVDEILKHDSFTRIQKAKVAALKNSKKVQKANLAGFKQQQLQQQQQQQQQQQLQQQHQQQKMLLQQQLLLRQRYGVLSKDLTDGSLYDHHHHHRHHHQLLNPHNDKQTPQQQHLLHAPNHNKQTCIHNQLELLQRRLLQHQQLQRQQQQLHLQHNKKQLIPANNNVNQKQPKYYSNQLNSTKADQSGYQSYQRTSISASLSTIGSTSVTSDEEEEHHHYYREYSLLGPGMTFELPCLRAAAERHNLRKLSFLS